MIKNRSEMRRKYIEIDLDGPEGNAFNLMALAMKLGRQLGFSRQKCDAIVRVMRMSNYEGLVHTFDVEFGDYVILYRNEEGLAS